MLSRTLWIISGLLSFCYISCNDTLSYVPEYELRNRLWNGPKGFCCAVIKSKATESRLETALLQLKKEEKFKNIIIGALPKTNESTTFTAVDGDRSLPVLRCFLGASLKKDYQDKADAKLVAKWIKLMEKEHKRQWQDNIETLLSSVSAFDVTILGLPSFGQSQLMDSVITEVKLKLHRKFSLRTLTIHPESKHKSSIETHLKIPRQSTVAVFTKFDQNQRAKMFKGQDIQVNKLTVYILSQMAGLKHLTVKNFEYEVLTVKKTERYRPYIVAFYSWWANHSEAFLNLLRSAVHEFEMHSIMSRFALVNVGEEKTVISRYIDLLEYKSIPFIGVFQKEKGKDTVNQTLLTESHPSTFYLYQALRSKSIWLEDAWGAAWDFSPYKTIDDSQYCDLKEGPWGSVCMLWMSNLTDSDIPTPQAVPKVKVEIENKSSLEKVMSKIEGVPVMTKSLWDVLIEKSEIKVLTYSEKADIKVTMVAFIRHGCSSCMHKLKIFREVYQELKKYDNSDFYLVNCSKDTSLCNKLRVQGFPSVMAFRSFANLMMSTCKLPDLGKLYVNRDYHGPLSVNLFKALPMKWLRNFVLTHQTDDLMKWHKDLTKPAVYWLATENPRPVADMVEDIRLVATVIPKSSMYLPITPGHDRNYFYPAQCLRVACERLFGLASCYEVYSKEIPETEYRMSESNKMVVAQIVFERKDGVVMKLMSLGSSLLELIEEETSSSLHLFHKPHNYALHSKQKCEEDHQACTQFIVSYTQDHMRLPVTQLTSEIFHTKNNPVFANKRPVLIALGHSENITSMTTFMQVLNDVAAHLYKDVTVAVLDVDQFPAWAGTFVPRHYYKLYADSNNAGPLHVYPRICLIDWEDHHHAAFYPPLDQILQVEKNQTSTGNLPGNDDEDITDVFFYKDKLVEYVKEYLRNPADFKVETEHF